MSFGWPSAGACEECGGAARSRLCWACQEARSRGALRTYDINYAAGLALVADDFFREIQYLPLEEAPPARGTIHSARYVTLRQLHHVARSRSGQRSVPGWTELCLSKPKDDLKP
ncbi:MAG TPA: hypothetical protein VGM15_03095 [Burkholderiaceae bacterium]|jgi:hypothetical protein